MGSETPRGGGAGLLARRLVCSVTSWMHLHNDAMISQVARYAWQKVAVLSGHRSCDEAGQSRYVRGGGRLCGSDAGLPHAPSSVYSCHQHPVCHQQLNASARWSCVANEDRILLPQTETPPNLRCKTVISFWNCVVLVQARPQDCSKPLWPTKAHSFLDCTDVTNGKGARSY
jgi:hypothetical protein